MCNGSCSRHTIFVLLVFCFAFGAIALLTAALVSVEWFQFDSTILEVKTGLWRVCTKNVVTNIEICVIRDEVLKFNADKDADAALLINVLALLFSVLSTISGMVYICYLKPPKWALGILITMTILAAGMSVALVTFVELVIYDDLSGFDRGWGFFTAYGGMASAIFAAIFACCLPCVKSAYHNYQIRSEKEEIHKERLASYQESFRGNPYENKNRQSTKTYTYEEPIESLKDVKIHKFDQPRMSIYNQDGRRLGNYDTANQQTNPQYQPYRSDIYYVGDNVAYEREDRLTRASFKRLAEQQASRTEVYYPSENITQNVDRSKPVTTYQARQPRETRLVELNEPPREVRVIERKPQPNTFHAPDNVIYKYENRASRHEHERKSSKYKHINEERSPSKPYVVEAENSTFPEDRPIQRRESKVVKKVVTKTTSVEPRERPRPNPQKEHEGYGISLETSHREPARNQIQVYDHSGRLVDKVAVVNTRSGRINQAFSR